MNLLNLVLETLSSPAWSRFMMALLHSLWLGVIWAGVLALLLRRAGNNPQLRYRQSLLSLGGLVFSVLIAWAAQETDWKKPEAVEAPVVSAVTGESVAAEGRAVSIRTAPVEAEPRLRTACALLWAAGCTVMLMRMLARMVQTSRIRGASELVGEGPLRKLLEDLQQKIGLHRTVRLAANRLVSVPCVAGILSPMILLPAWLLAGLPPEQLRAVLLHELAHIRRHDYVINLAQQVVEAFLFFNPAVWWINRQIRLEREACCDRLAAHNTSESEYAATLLDFAGRTFETGPVLEPAFPGDRQPSTLLERTKRLLIAGYQPVVRLPWHTSLVMLFCAGALLFTAWRGTRLAVTLAADLLSAQQRIEKIAGLKSQTALEERTYTDADNITIEGRVRTSDGTPLPKGLLLSYLLESPQSSIGYSGLSMTNGHFRRELKYGTVHLAVSTPGWAPAFLGPLRMQPGGALTNLELVLGKGFAGSIRVTGPDGRALAGVQLEGTYQTPTGSVPIKLTTDESGAATVEHAADAPLRWMVTAKGYQNATFENVRLAADQPVKFELKAARPTRGQVVSKANGNPVAGAAIRLVHRSGGSVFADLNQAPMLGTTDDQGRFVVDSLADGYRHILAFEADGFATRILRNVEPGQDSLRVELGPEIIVTGRIEGDLSRLTRIPEPIIHMAQAIQLEENSRHSYSHNIPVTIENGAATFTLTDLREGELSITAGGEQFEYFLNGSKTNLVLKLAPRKEGLEIRKIVIKLTPPPNSPPVQGQLEVTRAREEDGNYHREFEPIENGEVTFDGRIGTWLSWSTRAVVGYWVPGEGNLNIEPGEGPQRIEIRALPAGAIHGVVRGADGSDIGGVMISVVEVASAPGKQGSLGDVGKNTANPHDGPTRFVAQPLPLGGEYMVVARRDHQIVVSKPIAISEENPIQEVELRFVKGEQLRGVVRGPAGKALSGVPISLTFNTPFGSAFGIAGSGSENAPTTDAEGRFSIGNLNHALPGSYTITIDRAIGFQPMTQRASFNEMMELRLERGEKLSGLVIDEATGKPLVGATFYLFAADFRVGDNTNLIEADGPSNSEGRFEFSRAAGREYRLNCRDGEIVSPKSTIRFPRKSSEPLIVKLKPTPGARLSIN